MDLPSRGESSKWWRVSLRAKGVAALAAPIAALFGALFSVYWVEGDVRGADQDVARFYGIRDQLVELRSSLLDDQTAASTVAAEKARTSIQAALDRVGAQTAGDPAATAALAEIRRAGAEELRLLDQIRAAGRSSELVERDRAAMADLQARIALLNEHEQRRFAEADKQRARIKADPEGEVARERLRVKRAKKEKPDT